MNIRRIFASSALVCMALTACGEYVAPDPNFNAPAKNRYDVQVDGIRSQAYAAIVQKSFLLMPASKEIQPTDLNFQEYARYVAFALVQRGFLPAKDLDHANLIIYLDYGMGEPRVNTYSYAIPIVGQTGVSSMNTAGQINSYGMYTTYQGTTSYVPSYGIIGVDHESVNYTTYSRFLTLDAIDYLDYKKNKTHTELWKMSVTSTGLNGDLRDVMPYLVTASRLFFGFDTQKEMDIKVDDDDPEVSLLRDPPACAEGVSPSVKNPCI